MKKVIVIGIDGANWNLIAPWIQTGKLPNLKKLRESGCWGESLSCFPAATVPNWKCYSTGKNPGKLGVYWFEYIDLKNRKLKIPSSHDYKSSEFWDYMNKKGLKVGIINMPTTYPPKKIDKILISGGPDAEYGVNKNYTYPPKIGKYLKRKFKYKVHPDRPLTSKDEIGKEIDEVLTLIEQRFKVAKDPMFKDMDFLHVTAFYINVLHHFFWRDEVVLRAWKIIDKNLKSFMRKNWTIILMSDHGCHDIETEFSINTWLKKEGYLKTKLGLEDLIQKFGINRVKLLRYIKKVNLVKPLKRVVPVSLQKLIPSEDGFQFEKKIEKIEWEKTRAIGSGGGLIYLNVDKKDANYEPLRREIMNKLTKLKIPGTNKKIIKEVYKSEDVYSGPYLEDGPDIVYEQIDSIHTNESIGEKMIFRPPKKWKAENIRSGIFLIYGSDIRKGLEIKNVKIIDLAPTILHIFNVPIPKDMDGKVIKDVFKPGSELAKRKVRYQEIRDEREIIKESIKKIKIR